MTEIYHDNGAAFGRRTRVFRDGPNGGVEWMYGADWASGDTRWYGYLSTGKQETIASLRISGMDLSRFESGAWPERIYRSELTPAGEQMVIPGCERDDTRTGARQMDLF